jgi:transposase InsO family protein|tara:strand:- start:638 stop:1471 length:834 start_codon:yes stop_codon:yes gene_type:complete
MHKNTKLLPYQRREVYRRWREGERATNLSKHYGVTRKTLYEVFKKAKLGIFTNYSSKNLRYRTLGYGLKRLAKVEARVGKKLTKRERRLNRYQKEHPGEMVHTDSSTLPLLRGEAVITPREYLYVFVDDYSRFLFADILPDQTSWSAAICLDEALIMMPFEIKVVYSDNGKEFKKAFKDLCIKKNIKQQFTRPYRPQTNGKAERVIKTIKTELLKGQSHVTREERRRHLYAFTRHYNQVRCHQGLGNVSPMTYLESYIARTKRELKELAKLKSVTNA